MMTMILNIIFKLTLEEYTALGLDAPFSRETLNSMGMSPKAGILYAPGPRVNRKPSGEYFCCSSTNSP